LHTGLDQRSKPGLHSFTTSPENSFVDAVDSWSSMRKRGRPITLIYRKIGID
jgi:hypothetical protein